MGKTPSPETRTLDSGSPLWPRLWGNIPDPPERIHASGELGLLNAPAVAIVGTRRCTVRGQAMTRALASALSVRGWCIVSGLAKGIDAAAHQGALDVDGSTLAVMGTGLDRTYPRGHEQLRHDIETSGCVITEFEQGSAPRPFHFPRRNRLIAALVQAVIVVEAPLKSGALRTAYLALDYNREVFAVPGSVDLNTSRGCHHLLREGAHLLETAADVVAVLGSPPVKGAVQEGGGPEKPGFPAPGSAARWIFDRLDFEGVLREDLHARWAGSEDKWSEGMLALELAGLIRRLPGGALARSIW